MKSSNCIKWLLVVIGGIIPDLIFGQLVLTPGLTATQIAAILAGPGIQISNAVITSPSNYYSSFDASATNLGINSGILLTTGDYSVAIGPNNDTRAATVDNNLGDLSLEAIAGVPTFDAAVLEFDFIPQNDTIKFRYVFASEEFPEYVCSTYNDLFGFFITGPGLGGAQNIALIPGTTTPVAINSVNSGTAGLFSDPSAICNLSYPNYYVDNTNGLTIQYDGMTTVLTAMVIVIPCEVYHFKIVLADAGDADFDSGVFLEAGSLSSTPIVYAGADASLCSGAVQQLGLAPTSGWSYSWTPTAGISNPVISNPTVTLANASGSTVTSTYILNATNGTCILKDTVVFTVNPTPSASFTPLSTLCEDDTVTVQYTGNATLNATYNWTFSNATVISGSGAGPFQVYYPNPGNFPVILSVNYSGCPSATSTDSIRIIDRPISNFSFPNPICSGDSATLSFTGTAPVTSTYSWGISGGAPSSYFAVGPFTTQYAAAGKRQITLLVNNQGCFDTHVDSILVNQSPTALITGSLSACSNDTLSFSFSGSASTSAFYNWQTSSSVVSGSGIGPINIFNPTVGNDSLRLIVNDFGCRDTVYKPFVVYQQPVAAFTSNSSICENTNATINFTGVGATTANMQWNFQGANPNSGNGVGPFTLKYSTPGNYGISLFINNNGCIDSFVDSIIVNEKPQANFSATNACDGFPSNITNTSTIQNGSIAFNSWTFGDFQISNLVQPINHLYNSVGQYTISLVVTSDQQCKDTIERIIFVNDVPVSSFTTDSVCFGKSSSIDDASSILNGSIVDWKYNFNNSTISNNPSFAYSFSTTGNHFITLITTSDSGCVDSTLVNAYVRSSPEITIAANPRAGCQPIDVSFQSFIQSVDGSIQSLIWEFGDGDSSIIDNPNHTYIDPGKYDVSVYALSEFNCATDSVFEEFIEVYANPTAAFANDPSNTEMLAPVIYFTNQSSGATNYNWLFGDSSTSNDIDPIHPYNAPGTYDITLVSISSEGCRDTTYGEVIIKPSYTLYIPNTFTPNNDSKNDNFLCFGTGIIDFNMQIFNRWGDRIFTSNDMNQGWDGSYQDKEPLIDTYIYQINVIDVFNKKHLINGRVSIVK